MKFIPIDPNDPIEFETWKDVKTIRPLRQLKSLFDFEYFKVKQSIHSNGAFLYLYVKFWSCDVLLEVGTFVGFDNLQGYIERDVGNELNSPFWNIEPSESSRFFKWQ